eukprot:1110142-Pyramimonas_sp.AAC.1
MNGMRARQSRVQCARGRAVAWKFDWQLFSLPTASPVETNTQARKYATQVEQMFEGTTSILRSSRSA